MMPAILLGRPVPLTPLTHAEKMPLHVKEQILDAVLAREIERLERLAQRKEALPVVPALPDDWKMPALPDDPKVREVLENGGFSFVKRKDGSEVYEYERLGRAGQPLQGKEAVKAPRYLLVRWGVVILRCSCQAARGTSDPCKHQKALAWWLGLPVQKAEDQKPEGEQS